MVAASGEATEYIVILNVHFLPVQLIYRSVSPLSTAIVPVYWFFGIEGLTKGLDARWARNNLA